MAAELVLTTDARQDLMEAYAWYESQRIGLVKSFCLALKPPSRKSAAIQHFMPKHSKNIEGLCREDSPMEYSLNIWSRKSQSMPYFILPVTL